MAQITGRWYNGLDDYHSWQGSKKAFNEVFGNSLKIHTIDRTAIYVKKERP